MRNVGASTSRALPGDEIFVAPHLKTKSRRAPKRLSAARDLALMTVVLCTVALIGLMLMPEPLELRPTQVTGSIAPDKLLADPAVETAKAEEPPIAAWLSIEGPRARFACRRPISRALPSVTRLQPIRPAAAATTCWFSAPLRRLRRTQLPGRTCVSRFIGPAARRRLRAHSSSIWCAGPANPALRSRRVPLRPRCRASLAPSRSPTCCWLARATSGLAWRFVSSHRPQDCGSPAGNAARQKTPRPGGTRLPDR